jgi:hypothetical protein
VIVIALSLLSSQYLNAERFCGALLGTQAAGYALDRLDIIRVIVHGKVRAKAHARKAAHAILFLEAHYTCLVSVEGTSRADVDALPALRADRHTPFRVSKTSDTNRRFVLVDLLVPGLGADVLAEMASNAQLVVCD